MKLFSKKADGENSKISMKDVVIIILSLLSLVLLAAIIFASKKSDETISQQLAKDSKKETESVVEEITGDGRAIMISEVSSDGYVELYNGSSQDYDLNGCRVLLSNKEIVKITGKTVIKSEEYHVIDINVNPGAKANSVLEIINENGNIVAAMLVPEIPAGKSYGLIDVSAFDMAYMDGTKGVANKTEENPTYATKNGIGFSVLGGFYNSEFKLTMTADENCKIYYTTDGTEPTTDSAVYAEPISIKNKSGKNYVYAAMGVSSSGSVYLPGRIDKGMIVRAIMVDQAGNIKGSATESYFPGMLKDSAFLDIPVISLTINPEYMFDYFNGIYVGGRSLEDDLAQGGNGMGKGNYYNGWSKNARLEYFEADKTKTYENDISVKIFVDEAIKDRQKSLTFTITDSENVDHEYLGSSIQKYISANKSLSIIQNYSDNDIKVRDLLMNKLMEGSNVGIDELMPVSLFIDGEYWGLYMMKAPYDEAYIERQFGVKNQEILFHTYGSFQTEFNQFKQLIENTDMTIDENYALAESMMDMDSYLEFICLNMFSANTSFGSLNTTQWRTREVTNGKYCDGKWRWIISRMDNSLNNGSNQSYTIDSFLSPNFTKDRFLQSLLCNKHFCEKLYSTMESMTNDRLTGEKAEVILQELSELLEKPTAASRQRFSGTKSGQFDSGVATILNFFANRKEFIMLYVDETAKKGGDLSFVEELESPEESANVEEGENEDVSEDTDVNSVDEGN